MKSKKVSGKAGLASQRRMKDLSAKKSGEVRGGVRDAASGLPTGKRSYKPIT